MNEEQKFEDYRNRLNIRDVLTDAGYTLHKRDGLRYPAYVRLDNDGRRIRGDKFIVMPNKNCCFQPPTIKLYSVTSFIWEHPNLFPEYNQGMKESALVHKVCQRLLNIPVEQRNQNVLAPTRDAKPFNIKDYKIERFHPDEADSQKPFYAFFKSRGIDFATRCAFHRNFFLASKAADNGASYKNLSFPMYIPGLQNLVVPYLGKKQIQKVQTYDLEQFYATLSRTPRGLYKQGVKQTLTDKQKRQFLTGASIREVHAMLKTAFSYAVEWGLLLKSPIPREAPKSTSEERAIWDEKTMLAALQTMTDPTLHLAVHLSMILSLRVGEILGLQPGDIDFDAADGRGTITVGRSLQRTEKAALEKTDPNQIYHIFPDQREGSSSALVLKKPKTKKSSRTLYLTRPLKEELLAWLEKLRQDELAMDGRYRNCGQLFRLPNGMPVAPEALSKWYRTWRAEHPEFEKIVFHGLRHSSATYQLLQSGGDFKSVQGNTGHATATVLMDTYAHTQDKPRLELTEKIEANFYSQDVAGAKPQEPPENKTPVATKITGTRAVLRMVNGNVMKGNHAANLRKRA